MYAQSGVREYWVVFQEVPRTDVYRLGTEGKFARAVVMEEDTITTPLLPEF